ncbi:alpha/beta fold hydrolase [Jannaschia seohaensis]|uniref:DNA-binding winged helix-turn-helix (WHTH) domain-containing protein n=1 Tax=Jannaschia seohaensis TaxID=475081 RepID=A0A2Y9BBK2_9RHOB|nr:alpha/beta fold hydrolase [Jannaschia seohaensis]PWJ10509.1 DNA-binding winged helix-turn-helix (wHTH) protein [Jannaschia seohaensis]SSA51659.1 DNA-binding winged helix-turn-helix (wHTH) domain-containing protein [Jannaschia seohaensis]
MIFSFSDCTLDTERVTLTRQGAAVPVEPKVFDLIELLVRNAGRVVPTEELVAEIWGGRAVSDGAITARVSAARKALGDTGAAQRIIRTVSRRGLELVGPVKQIRSVERCADRASADLVETDLKIRFTASRDGSSIAYAVSGDGRPLVLVRPPMMTDLEQLSREPFNRALMERLGRTHQILTFDQLGCGQSDRTAAHFDFADHVDELKQVMDAAQMENAAVVALSGGVHAALRLAAQFPERVSKLVLVGGYVTGRALRRNAPDPLRGLMEEASDQQSPTLTEAFMLAYWPEGPLETLREKARIVRSATSPGNALRMRDMINQVSNADMLQNVRCPTLVIHGRNDSLHPISEARALAAGIPNSEMMVLETANHWPLPGNSVWLQFLYGMEEFLARRIGPDRKQRGLP